jgi:tRNA pseudouridine65 synthase
MLKILFQDEHYVAIHKPPKILVHLTAISEDTDSVVRQLRAQIGEQVSPVHRLDRGTSGVLIFGRSADATRALAAQFEARTIEKKYLAIVRGHLFTPERVDYPITRLDGAKRDAVTDYTPLAQTEIPISAGKYPNSRYSLVDIQPQTGRFRQIRQHFSHLRHPIIGDKKHGDVKHNKLFEREFDCDILLLLARKLSFEHPFTGEELSISSEPEDQMLMMISRFGWNTVLSELVD